mmetsp:Transcript_1845/g.5771  ORF Transcript_1845/g.5771 Transcript_1845/m.5771 type:complete len:224 (-) Transcript_1845:751-1422(-)
MLPLPSSISDAPSSTGWKQMNSDTLKLAASGSLASAHAPAPEPTTIPVYVVAKLYRITRLFGWSARYRYISVGSRFIPTTHCTRAAVPNPACEPAVPSPTMVVTTPSVVVTRRTRLSGSAVTYRCVSRVRYTTCRSPVNRAAGPAASAKPGVPACPASVLTTALCSTTRRTVGPAKVATYRLSVLPVIPSGVAKLAAVPVPSALPDAPDPAKNEMVCVAMSIL